MFRSLAALALLLCVMPATAAVTPSSLRVEFRANPLGVDVPAPRLSWTVTSRQRGQRQSAYRVLVASSPSLLREGRADLWDSGRVASDETLHIAYAGKPLVSGQVCHWTVRAWDGDGFPSAWSKRALWQMGLLQRSDWQAQWIGCPIDREAMPDSTYLPATLLRRVVDVRPGLRRATLYATAAGLYEALIDGRRVGRDFFTPGWTEYAKRFYYQTYDVTGALKAPGRHALAAMVGDGWYGLHHGGRGRLALLAHLRLEYADGRIDTVVTDGQWKASVEGPVLRSDIYHGEDYDARREMEGWATAGFDDSGWKAARVGFGAAPGVGVAVVTDTVRAAVKDNALTIGANNQTFGDPAYGAVKALTVVYRQGGKTHRASAPEGEALRIAADGPLTIVSARWGAQTAAENVDSAVLQAHPGVPVRKTGEVRPVKRTEPKPGTYVFDLGQNFSGWARLRVRAEAGRKITLRFAEMLNPDGTVYTTNLRAARCTDTYVCRGGGTEVWEPRFTFHGFRYVEVTGLAAAPGLDTITGVVLNSDAPITGSWESSNALLNRLYQNIVWGQRSNYLEVPTDCPQRDERMGWSGDAQVFIGTGAYVMDVSAFFTAWMPTFNDSQDAQGGYPNVSPKHWGVSPAWGDAGVICPWTLYRVYGDRRVISDHWAGMVRWIDYLRARSRDLVRPAEGFGDWLNLGAEMPKDVISTAYFANSARLMSEMAGLIDRPQEAAAYRALFEDIRAAYNRAFVSADGRIKGDTQTTYLMALGFDLLPQHLRAPALARLLELFKERSNHISTGFLGVNLLLPVLAAEGHTDLAWTLLTNTGYPSWLYSVRQGATTIWERWDGWTEEKGFQDPGMNSFNHYAYGSCGQWMFAGAAGIDTDGPAFKQITIRPVPGGKVDRVKARYVSVRGPIAVSWRKAKGRFMLDVEVPANTTATVHVPAAGADQVTEGGAPAASAEGVRFVRYADGRAVYAVGSGTYRFAAPAP